eukprot:TRINITY_DN51757_c0_g1_i1.p1 TRINITY_DN51757_c0_g1~~TRINITY_DN51757_c0_g1_i1.p1  ORF type:complete len:215 (-),score=9.71 TRINITY_DN51757_c0_g1_i1:56-616(-)
MPPAPAYTPVVEEPPKKEPAKRSLGFLAGVGCGSCCCITCLVLLVIWIVLCIKFKVSAETADLDCDVTSSPAIVSFHKDDCSGYCYQGPAEYMHQCIPKYVEESSSSNENMTGYIMEAGACQAACGGPTVMKLMRGPDFWFRAGQVCSFYNGTFPTIVATQRTFLALGSSRWLLGWSWRHNNPWCA